MFTRDLLKTAYKGITINKTRTGLTMLGIIIGVASVVLMVSMGSSFQNYILAQVNSVGTKTMAVLPAGLQKFGGNLQGLTVEDYNAIKQLSTVTSVAPVIIIAKPVSYGKDQISPLVAGTYPEMIDNYSMKLATGRLLDKSDNEGAKSVVIIGGQVAEDLFGNDQPLDKQLKIGDFSFTIVGVLQKAGSALLSQLDSIVMMPFSVARAVSGQKYLSYINLQSKGDGALTKEDITLLLRQRHRLDNPTNDPDKDDFIVRGTEQAAAVLDSVTLGLTVFLSLVAAISLIVGGIGIMNIMLVSVTERTKEIGLRKAVGAKRRDILLQFLIEAVVLTVLGGLIGIVIGVAFGWLLSLVAARALGSFDFIVSISSIVFAVLMSIGTGLLFGVYPARKASMLTPMEALRYE